MNAIRILLSQPWVERLGWVLVHFLWQGTLIAAVYAAARYRARSSRPQLRYLLACAALAAMLAAPVATWTWLGAPGSEAVHAPGHFAALDAAAPSAPSVGLVAMRFDAGGRDAQSFLGWVVLAWLAGAIALWIRLIGGWMAGLRLRSRFVHPAPAEWQRTFHRLAARLRVSRPARLLVSAVAQTPAVIGWLRPVVLVPAGALAGLPPDQVEALLLHELAHIRRGDYLVGMLQSLAEAILFYHPAIWWVSGHIRTERELCCDDIAVAEVGDVITYARALAAMETSRLFPTYGAVAANGGSLVERIARLLGQPRPMERTFPGPAAMAILLGIAALGVIAQPAARPKFEVASIKPSEQVSFMAIRPLPSGRLIVNAPLRLMIQNAYRLQPFQIVGGPRWIDSERYTIEAKAEGNPDRAQMMEMLQSLIEDRFHFQSHRETRELPVYDLVAAKGGVKMAAPSGHCADWDRDGPPPPPSGSGQSAVPCGHLIISLRPGNSSMQGDDVPVPELTRMLAVVLGRDVIDKTGYTGKLNIRLDFTPDSTTAGLPNVPRPMEPINPPPSAESGPPSIFTVVQQQLGLKVESTKGPVEVLVIDHVERPSAN